MTEKTLLLRCATSEPFFIISTDLPSARVFDTSSSKLLSVVEVPKRSQGHALSTMSLKSVAITTLVESATSSPTKARGASKARAAVVEGEQIRECYAAIGLSDGTVVIRNITKGTPGQHVAVSETQHPIVSMAFCDAFLFCLSENGFFYVVDVLDSANGTCLRVRTPAEASAIQVTRWVPDGGEDASSAQQGYQVLVAGPTNAVFIVHQQGHSRGEAPRLSAEKSISFASQGPAVDYVWLSDKSLAANGSIPAATASAQEGVVRLWDVRPEAKHGDSQRTHSALVARCRRTLLCGQRIASLSVQEGKTGAQVVATTFTGCVLMWCLDGCVIPSTVEPTPLPPTIALVSAIPQGRLLYGAVIGGGAHSADAPLTDVSLLLLRGRFALPMFECLHVASAMEQYTHRSGALAVLQAQRKVATLSSLGYGAAASITVVEVPLETSASSPFAASEGTIGAGGDTVGASFQVMDHLWLQHQHRVAAKAMLTPTESFEAIRAYHASSMKDLPVKQLTLEQRLREVARRHNPAKHVAAGEEGQVDGALPDGSTEQSFTLQHSLGMATVPLYQALHANDVSSVMDLLSLAARSNEGIRSVVTALHLPYCLQLLSILSERLGMCSTTTVKGAHSGITVVGGSLVAVSTRSPMLRWISAIVQHRGMELYAVQREASSRITPAATSEAQKPAARLPDGTSPPAHFLAPVLHQYRSMCSQYDKLATLYGRLSIFSAARPSEKNQFVNRSRKMMSSNLELGLPTNNTLSSKRRLHSDVLQDDLLFPAMFAEVRTKSRAPRTVRVRSRVAMELKRRAKATSDAALLRQAQQTKKDGDGASPLDDDNDEAMERIMEDAMHEGDPLEALDAMGLDSDKDSIDSDDEEEECEESASGEDDDSDAPARRKKARHEDVMLADEHSEEDDDAAELDSDEAEFSEGSDDDVVSSILDGDGSDEESSSDDEEEDDDDGDNENGKDDDESSDDSGLGDDMKELLEQHADQSDKQAKRQFKKVRTD